MNLILHSVTTSSNIYCNIPMHLSGLGDKFGLKTIINAIKTPDKEPAFFPCIFRRMRFASETEQSISFPEAAILCSLQCQTGVPTF